MTNRTFLSQDTEIRKCSRDVVDSVASSRTLVSKRAGALHGAMADSIEPSANYEVTNILTDAKVWYTVHWRDLVHHVLALFGKTC